MTLAESRLWAMLRNRQVDGLKFRRQTPVAGAIVDFLCAELRPIIDLDGSVHRLREAEDRLRDQRLAQAGFKILRVANEHFLRNPNDLLTAIRDHATVARTQPLHPTGSAGHLLPRGEKDNTGDLT